MVRFNVTYEIYTQESAEQGDADERGFVGEGLRLRDAFEQVNQTRTCEVGGVTDIEADEWPVRASRWITIINGMEYRTGAQESRSLHIPDGVTPASRVRIARLMGVRGC